MALLYNLARMTTATSGTGTITLGSAVSGFLTFALAGVTNGQIVSYGIRDGANSEVGTGTYTSAGTTLSRTVTSSTNGGSAISLSGSAEVFITGRAEDFALDHDLTPELGGDLETNNFDIKFEKYSTTDDLDAEVIFQKSGNAVIGSHTIVVDGEDLGTIRFQGSNGTTFDTAALIMAEVDGTPGASNDMPGRLSFWTTPEASATPAERLRIDNAGRVVVGGTAGVAVDGDNNTFQIHGASADTCKMTFVGWSAGDEPPRMVIAKSRGGTISAHATVEDEDNLGGIRWHGSDGTEFLPAVEFRAEVSGTPGTGALPSAFVIRVNAGDTGTTQRLHMGPLGRTLIGLNATATRMLHIAEENSTTNAVTYVQRLEHRSSGTPANGIGVGMEFAVLTDTANTEVVATIEAVLTDVSTAGGASEDADLVFRTMTGGAAATEALRITSAGHLVLPASTLQTTPVDGSIEMDANCFYGTTDAGNRGYIPVRHFIRCDSARTLPNDTATNAIFNSPANGAITLETGTYLFEGLILVTGMSATSGNAFINLLGAGSATVASWLWLQSAIDAVAASTLLDDDVQYMTGSTSAVVTATTGTVMRIWMKGSFEVTGAGTLIPSIDQVTATAASAVSIGSYFMCERIGSTSVVSVGQWS